MFLDSRFQRGIARFARSYSLDSESIHLFTPISCEDYHLALLDPLHLGFLSSTAELNCKALPDTAANSINSADSTKARR